MLLNILNIKLKISPLSENMFIVPEECIFIFPVSNLLDFTDFVKEKVLYISVMMFFSV